MAVTPVMVVSSSVGFFNPVASGQADKMVLDLARISIWIVKALAYLTASPS